MKTIFYIIATNSPRSRRTEPVFRPVAFLKRLHHIELGSGHRQDDHLRDAVAGVNGEFGGSAVPAGDEYLALIIRIDESGEVAEDDAVFVAEAGAGQQHRRVIGVGDVDGDAGGNQFGGARLQGHRPINAGGQVKPGGAVGAIAGEAKFRVNAGVENSKIYFHRPVFTDRRPVIACLRRSNSGTMCSMICTPRRYLSVLASSTSPMPLAFL